MSETETIQWVCPVCGAQNRETPDTTMAECQECGEAFDLPGAA